MRVFQELGPDALCPYNSPLAGQRHVGANVEISGDALPAILSDVSVKLVAIKMTAFVRRITQVQRRITVSGMECLRPTRGNDRRFPPQRWKGY